MERQEGWLGGRWARVAISILLVTMVAEIVHAVRGQSLTWDEGDHIFAGY